MGEKFNGLEYEQDATGQQEMREQFHHYLLDSQMHQWASGNENLTRSWTTSMSSSEKRKPELMVPILRKSIAFLVRSRQKSVSETDSDTVLRGHPVGDRGVRKECAQWIPSAIHHRIKGGPFSLI